MVLHVNHHLLPVMHLRKQVTTREEKYTSSRLSSAMPCEVRLQPTEADRKVLEEQRRAAAAELEDDKDAQGDGE